MKSLSFFFIFFALFHVNLIAQSSDAIIDSLILELSVQKSDTGKIKIMNGLASYYRNINLTEAEKYARQCLNLAKKTNFKDYDLRALYLLGVIYRMQGDMDKALDYGKLGLANAEREKNWRWSGSNCSALGNTYSGLGIHDTAMIYYFKAIDFYEKANTPAKTANIYNNLGNNLYKQKKDDLAKEYLNKALSIYREHNQMSKAAMTLMNLGRREKNDSIAMDYFFQSLRIHTQNNDLQGIASVSMNIGSNLISNKKYEAALSYYNEGLRLATKVGHKSKMATANSSLGLIYFKLNQPEQAIAYYETAIELSEKTKFREEEKQTYNNLAYLYADQEDFKKAFDYLKTSRDLGDSLLNKNNMAITSELEAKYDAKQKEADIASQQLVIEQQKNSKSRLLIFGILILLGITAVFQRYYYYQKRKKQEALLALESQRIEAENLRTLSTLKANFFANISHELKTPLTMIITPLEEAIQNFSDDNLVLAQHNSKKLFNLVNEILDLSKLEAGQLELKETNVQLYPLVRRIFFSFQSLSQRRNISLDLHYNIPQFLKVKLDIEKFEKILNNLLSNALKFSKVGDTIHFIIERSMYSDNKHFLFKVIDQGPGIPQEDIDKIFDRFYQNKGGKKAGGTGIGLTLSKELAQLLGGDLFCESQVVKGSIFTLKIPLEILDSNNQAQEEIYDPNERFIPKKPKPGTLPTYQPILLNGQKPRILIVEDNIEMSDFLIKTLMPYYKCYTAFNGQEALKKLEGNNFDLITSDVMMPEVDGFEFRKKMNKNIQWRQTPFIMLTASTLEDDRLKGLGLGVDDYITKPFSSRELLARIDNLLTNKSERELFQKEENDTAPPESADFQLLKQAEQMVMDHIHDPNFKVIDLAREVGYSQRQLTRIIKRLTGLSPVNFILEIRLQKAYQLFQNRQFSTVSEIRYEVGIESAAYFTTKFKARFGKNPKEYLA